MATTYVIKLSELKAIADIHLAAIVEEIRDDQRELDVATNLIPHAFDSDLSADLDKKFQGALAKLDTYHDQLVERINLSGEGLRDVVANHVRQETDATEAAQKIKKQLEEMREQNSY